MKKFTWIALVLALSVALSACALPNSGEADGGGDAAVAVVPTTAPPAAEASGEQPTVAPVEAPTEAPAAESAPTSEPTAVPEASFNVTDALSHLDDFVLQPEDLPHSYRVPVGGESRYTNTTVVNEMGELPAKKYIVATGRVDGWRISLERARKADIAPARIESTMELFETNEGARLALTPEWFKAYQTGYSEAEITWIEDGCSIGDGCILYTHKLFNPASNLTTTTYEVAFVYRNVLVWVMGRGLDVEMSADYMIAAAQAVYDRISQFE